MQQQAAVSAAPPIPPPALSPSEPAVTERDASNLHSAVPTNSLEFSENAQSNILVSAGSQSTSVVIPHKRLHEESSLSEPQKINQAATGQENRARNLDEQTGASNAASLEAHLKSSEPRPSSGQTLSSAILQPRRSSTPLSRSSDSVTVENAISSLPKRRRIENQNEETPVGSLSRDDVDLPIPSTETDSAAIGVVSNPEAEPLNTQTVTTQQPVKPVQPVKPKKPGVPTQAKKRQNTEQRSGDAAVDTSQESSSRPTKTARSRNPTNKSRKQSLKTKNGGAAVDAVQLPQKKRKGRKKGRALTPEGAADVRIEPSKVKMSELCKNTNTGKKSTRQRELEELDKAKAARKEQNLQEIQEATGSSAQTNEPAESSEDRLERLARAREEVTREVPNTIIVDGQIQVDETSLQLDRHANAARERDAEQLEGVDESELTLRINAGSWLKRDKGGSWNEESTDMFYDALRMFGTDFGMISKMFPGRTRHSIKLKFCREEKLDMQRIKDTLMGARIPINLEEFSKMSNTVYDDPKELERDLAEDRKRLEAEQAAEKAAMDEIRKERERQVAAESAAAGGESSAKENQGQVEGTPEKRKRGTKASGEKKRARGKKASGGENGEVLSPIVEG